LFADSFHLCPANDRIVRVPSNGIHFLLMQKKVEKENIAALINFLRNNGSLR